MRSFQANFTMRSLPMLSLILSMALIGQDNYVKGYQPKADDKAVLVPSSGSSLYVATSFEKLPALDKAIKANDTAGLEGMVSKGEIASVPTDTPVVYIKNHLYKLPSDYRSEVRIQDGSLKDKVVFCHTAEVRMLDPAKLAPPAKKAEPVATKAKAEAEKKPKREPLNTDLVEEDVRAAIKKAKAETTRLPSLEQKKQKEKLMKAAIETVCKKHKATLDEINTIATNAKIFVNFDGQTFNIAGKRVK
jgi:hypothetical protein